MDGHSLTYAPTHPFQIPAHQEPFCMLKTCLLPTIGREADHLEHTTINAFSDTLYLTASDGIQLY